VPPALRAHWEGLIDKFFLGRDALKGLVVVMDIRHPLRDFDRQMLGYGRAGGLHCHCLLTKADKLPRGQQAKALLETRRELGDDATVQLFSAESKQGVEQARSLLTQWLELPLPAAAT
jgi:GTP-binding protein